jgi:hypothetical protein
VNRLKVFDHEFVFHRRPFLKGGPLGRLDRDAFDSAAPRWD